MLIFTNSMILFYTFSTLTDKKLQNSAQYLEQYRFAGMILILFLLSGVRRVWGALCVWIVR